MYAITGSRHRLLFFAALLSIINMHCRGTDDKKLPLQFAQEQTSAHATTVTISYALEPSDGILKPSLHFSTSDTTLKLSEWRAEPAPENVYDSLQKTSIDCFKGTGKFTLTITRPETSTTPSTKLLMHFQRLGKAAIQEHLFTVNFAPTAPEKDTVATPPTTAPAQSVQQTTNAVSSAAAPHAPAPNITLPDAHAPTITGGIRGTINAATEWLGAMFAATKQKASGIVASTQSPWLKIIFIFILGFLMSLTPCIYPMIPITIGVLQSSAQASLRQNFIMASAYTIGIATTFSILGLFAALGGAQFGGILASPFFVLFMVLFLGYFALSMFGLYEIYIPQFFQSSHAGAPTGGSPLSAFTFGAVSGTVASPCLSPGLVLVLSIAAATGSIIFGFVYLFAFGLGLGMPLLLIGTFSTSFSGIPQAGGWMIEVKKIFGALLLAMCFYYVSPLVSFATLLSLASITILLLGIGTIYSVAAYDGTLMTIYKRTMGMLLIVVSFLVAFSAYKAAFDQTVTLHVPTLSYADARQKAINEHKLLLVDVGADWCSSCRAIQKQFFATTEFEETLAPYAIVTAINYIGTPEQEILKTKYTIQGVPAVLLIEPATETIIKRWSGDFLSVTTNDIVALCKRT